MKDADQIPLREAAAQYLAVLQSAGLTHLPRAKVPSSATSAGVSPGTSQQPAAQKRTGGHAAEKTLFATSPAATASSAPLPPSVTGTESMPPSPRTLEERQQALEQLARCVARCTRCEELARTRTQTVFGVGNPQARLLFLGEAPGADEDRRGEPFVGRAGQLLNRIIAACRLKREDVYICNILKCRPPGNRNPTPQEAANCREYLDGQISIVDPDYIVCWGSVAAKNLLNRTESIGRLRGRFYKYGRAKVLCTYHPSYLLRNPAAKKDVWEDMKFLFRDQGIELDNK